MSELDEVAPLRAFKEFARALSDCAQIDSETTKGGTSYTLIPNNPRSPPRPHRSPPARRNGGQNPLLRRRGFAPKARLEEASRSYGLRALPDLSRFA